MLTKFFVLAGSVPADPTEGMTIYGPYDTSDDAMAFIKDAGEPGEKMIIFSTMAEEVTVPEVDEPEPEPVEGEEADEEAEEAEADEEPAAEEHAEA